MQVGKLGAAVSRLQHVTTAKVSVVLNVMNGQDYLGQCIASVLKQSFEDFEFIIIDDGSTDATWDIISSFTDKRLKPIRQANHGIAESANLGISLARAPLIARIDHDDLMLPDRLERQVAAFTEEPDLALLCTAAQLIDGDQVSARFYTVPTSSAALRLRLLFDNPVVQSTVMMKTEVVKRLGGYLKRPLPYPEDFHLWVRFARTYPIRALPEALTQYRIRPGSASYGNKSARFNVEVSSLALHSYLGPEYGLAECESLAAIYHRYRHVTNILPQNSALAMFDKAAGMIGGARNTWDDEFKSAYAMQRRIIWTHGLLRQTPLSYAASLIPQLRLRD